MAHLNKNTNYWLTFLQVVSVTLTFCCVVVNSDIEHSCCSFDGDVPLKLRLFDVGTHFQYLSLDIYILTLSMCQQVSSALSSRLAFCFTE